MAAKAGTPLWAAGATLTLVGFGNWMPVCFGCVQAFADSPPHPPSRYLPVLSTLEKSEKWLKRPWLESLDVKLLIKMDMSVFNTEIYMMLGFIESFCIQSTYLCCGTFEWLIFNSTNAECVRIYMQKLLIKPLQWWIHLATSEIS